MLNYIWAGMIIIGIVYAVFTGSLDQLTNGLLESARESVTIVLAMLGIMAFWTGLMKIAERSGLIEGITSKMFPLLRFLFPRLKKGSASLQYISTNLIANVLGLGWAATPAGLKAMEELQKINPQKDRATREMCMFLIINMSSLQLVTISVVAYRAQYNSASPSEIIGPGFVVTLLSTIVAVVFVKLIEASSRD